MAIAEAIETFRPYFLAYPAAFGQWMRIMVNGYRDRAQRAGREPDPALLEPILEVLET